MITRTISSWRSSVFVGAAGLFSSSICLAVDTLPLDVVALPPDLNFVALYYGYGHNDQYNTSGKTFDKNTRLTTNTLVARVGHVFPVAGTVMHVDMLLPYGDYSNGAIGGGALNDAKGWGDPTLLASIAAINKPEQGTYFGITGYLTAPWGEYHKDDALNVGSNRWSGTFQLGISQRFAEVWNTEVITDWTHYGNNNEAGNGHQTLAQDDTYTGQVWLTRDFGSSVQGSIGYALYEGGAQQIDGVSMGIKTEKQQFRLAGNFQLLRGTYLILQLSRDFAVQDGFRQDTGVLARLAYAF